MTARTIQRWTVLHRWSSLFVTANLLLLAVTGLFLIFHEEIDDAFGLGPKVEQARDGTAAMIPMSRAVELALATRPPGWAPSTYFEDEEHPGLAGVALMPPGVKDFAQTKTTFVDRLAGRALTDYDPEKTLSYFVLRLHTDLFLGLGGSLYLAVVGLAFFFALVSGAVVYAPFVRGLAGGVGALRRGRGMRTFQLDLHNLVGVLTLVWCSVVALTGVVLELSRPIIALYQMTDLTRLTAPFRGQPAPTTLVPLERAAETATRAWPGHRVEFALFPGTPLSGDHHFAFFMATETGVSKRVFKLTMIDAATGALTAAEEAPWYVKTLLVSGPLHFGDYAGLPLKLLWAGFTLLTILLCVGGLYLTFARLRARRRHGGGEGDEESAGPQPNAPEAATTTEEATVASR